MCSLTKSSLVWMLSVGELIMQKCALKTNEWHIKN